MEFTYACKGFIDGKMESWTGKIYPLLPFDCTEFEIRSRGSTFHLVIGEHSHSSYIYIPTLSIAMDISYLDDRFWNREHLSQNYPDLSPVDAISIVEALVTIKKHIC